MASVTIFVQRGRPLSSFSTSPLTYSIVLPPRRASIVAFATSVEELEVGKSTNFGQTLVPRVHSFSRELFFVETFSPIYLAVQNVRTSSETLKLANYPSH